MSQAEDIAEAILGKDAEEFCRSELGQYVIGRSKQEKLEAQEELSKVYPWRRRKIQELQNRVWRAESIQSWLVELILNGQNAEKRMEYVTAED